MESSIIMALNARYEQAWDEHNRLDDRIGPDDSIGQQAATYRRKQAMEAKADETDALRQALLHQVPSSQDEALLVAAHLHTTFGLTDAFWTDEKDVDRLAFERGFDALLDYLFGETSFVGGSQLKALEKIVQRKRRLRCGLPEIDEGGE